jgi:hypothetical protein
VDEETREPSLSALKAEADSITRVSLSEKYITVVSSRYRLLFACLTSTRSRETNLKEERRRTRGAGCDRRLSHNPDLRRIADSKIFVYTSRQRHGINKKILSCFFEKRSIVLQSAGTRTSVHAAYSIQACRIMIRSTISPRHSKSVAENVQTPSPERRISFPNTRR